MRLTDVGIDAETGAVHIGVWMDGLRFTLIAMPVSQSPIYWLNSISLEEKGPESEKLLSDLQRVFQVRNR